LGLGRAVFSAGLAASCLTHNSTLIPPPFHSSSHTSNLPSAPLSLARLSNPFCPLAPPLLLLCSAPGALIALAGVEMEHRCQTWTCRSTRATCWLCCCPSKPRARRCKRTAALHGRRFFYVYKFQQEGRRCHPVRVRSQVGRGIRGLGTLIHSRLGYRMPGV
jgi:hypothetical protein